MQIEGKCRKCGKLNLVEMSDDIDMEWACVSANYELCDVCQKAEIEARQVREAEEKQRQEMEDYPARLKASRLPLDFFVDGFQSAKIPVPEMSKFIWANKYRSIVLSGDTGTCKTGLMIQYGLEMVKSIDVRFYKLTTLLNTLDELYWDKSTRSKARGLLRELATVELLILDDVGKEVLYENEKASEWFYDMLDDRYTRHLRTWITCNMGELQMQDKYGTDRGPAIIRRLTSNAAIWPEEKGEK